MESNTTCAANTGEKPTVHTTTRLCLICLNHTYKIVTNFTPIGNMDIFILRRLILQRCIMSSDTCKKETFNRKQSTIILAKLQPTRESVNSPLCQKNWDWRTSLRKWLGTTQIASPHTLHNQADKNHQCRDTSAIKSLPIRKKN